MRWGWRWRGGGTLERRRRAFPPPAFPGSDVCFRAPLGRDNRISDAGKAEFRHALPHIDLHFP